MDDAMSEVTGAWSLGVIQGLMQSAALVQQLTDHYSNPAARAALGLAFDSLLEKIAELTTGREPPEILAGREPPEMVLFYALRHPMEMPPQPKWMEENLETPKPEGWHPQEYWYKKYKAGKFVCLDISSGGYPGASSRLNDAKLWNTPEEADEYRKSFIKENFKRIKITITIEDDE